MDYQHLLSRVLRNAPFASREDAESALETTLETLGYMLPAQVVDELRSTLPLECDGALALGVTLRSTRALQLDADQALRLLNSLPWFTMDRIRDVCSVLGKLLPPALSEDVLFLAAVQAPRGSMQLVPAKAQGAQPNPWDTTAGNDLETRKMRRLR
jgi:uncharacterized protein (DUF2267 family)